MKSTAFCLSYLLLPGSPSTWKIHFNHKRTRCSLHNRACRREEIFPKSLAWLFFWCLFMYRSRVAEVEEPLNRRWTKGQDLDERQGPQHTVFCRDLCAFKIHTFGEISLKFLHQKEFLTIYVNAAPMLSQLLLPCVHTFVQYKLVLQKKVKKLCINGRRCENFQIQRFCRENLQTLA